MISIFYGDFNVAIIFIVPEAKRNPEEFHLLSSKIQTISVSKTERKNTLISFLNYPNYLPLGCEHLLGTEQPIKTWNQIGFAPFPSLTSIDFAQYLLVNTATAERPVLKIYDIIRRNGVPSDIGISCWWLVCSLQSILRIVAFPLKM